MRISFKPRHTAPSEGSATMTVAIDGMHCNSCAMSIDWEVEDVDGVSDSSTSYAKGLTRVTFDPRTVSADMILAAIGRAGFTGRRVDGDPTLDATATADAVADAIAPLTVPSATHPVPEESSPMETVTFVVPAITCGHCVATIKRVVTADVPGIQDVTGDPDAKRVTIQFAPPATVEQIVAAMTDWDYPPAV